MWQRAAHHYDLYACSFRQEYLDTICMGTKPWRRCLTSQQEPSCCFTACCSALEDRKGIIRGDNLSTLERCSVSCFLSFVLHHGCFSQKPGINGQIQWCYSLLVMLESQPNISFCVRDLIVFVCQSHQINCGVEWQTEPRPPSPSSLSVPQLLIYQSSVVSIYLY